MGSAPGVGQDTITRLPGMCSMATARSVSRQTSKPNQFVKVQSDDFWNELGIYPGAIKQTGSQQDVENEVRHLLEKLGRGNLRLLCGDGKIDVRPDLTELQFANAILTRADAATLYHLRELMKRRTEFVEQEYDRAFPQRVRTRTGRLVAELGHTQETVKPLTKLFLLYRKAPNSCRTIFFSSLWQSRSTSFELQLDGGSGDIGRTFRARVNKLATQLGKITRHGVTLSAVHSLPTGISVALFLRAYPPRIRRDFLQKYNILHDCGLIVVGLDSAARVLHIKSGNRRFAEVIGEFCKSQLNTEVRLLNNDVFSDYDQEQVRHAFLGRHKEATGIDLTEVSYARSSLPGRGPITVKTGFMQTTIRSDLQLLAESYDLLDIRGLADVTSLKASFKGRIAEITPETTKGGAIRLVFQNAGWPAELQVEFEQAFLDTFRIPVNKLLDPTGMSLGDAGVLAYLLTVRCENAVEKYQEEAFGFLCDHEYLTRQSTTVRCCTNNLCANRRRIVRDDTQSVCRRCDNSLEETTLVEVRRNDAKLVEVIAKAFGDVEPWTFRSPARKFEGREYYSLDRSDGRVEDGSICVVLQDRLTTETKTAFERFSQPLIVVQPVTEARRIYIDENSIGRISLSYLLAAMRDAVEWPKCLALCKQLTAKLMQSYKERIEKAARHSRAVLEHQRDKLNGARYERDIFNLMRVVFPYCHKLGRDFKSEPDGFVCIADYRETEGGLADAGSWNFTYDAKYSEKENGYELDRGEQRKMLDYITSFRNNRKILDGQHRKISAHIIVSNQVSNDRMQNAAGFLYGRNGLREKHRDVKLVLMREKFLSTLFDWMQGNAETVQTKRGYLLELMIQPLETAPAQSYLELGESQARSIIDQLSGYQVIEKRIPAKELETSLDKGD